MQTELQSLLVGQIMRETESPIAVRQEPAPAADCVHDHQHSAMYAASHLHSAVHHVKPRHSTAIEL